MQRYEHAFYEPMLSDWRNFETWAEHGATDATQRASVIWRRLLEEYEQPSLDAGIAEAIDDFVARREVELGH